MTDLSMPDLRDLGVRARAEELARLFKIAEDKIKLVENLNLELSIPAINELRYAGYHITRFIAAETVEAANEEFGKAEKHCKRAIYDAAEAGVTFQLEMIKTFQTDFRNVRIATVIPNYPEMRKQINAARDLVVAPRSATERVAYYEECSKHLEVLREAHKELESYREDLLQELQNNNRNSRNALIGFATLLVGAGALFYAALAYHSGSAPAPTVATSLPAPASPTVPPPGAQASTAAVVAPPSSAPK